MLINLTKYEFAKRWKALRYVLLGYILIQTLLLVISSTFFWNSNMVKVFTEANNEGQGIGIPSGMAMVLYFIMALGIAILPFIESLHRFDKDLSGKQSVLEQMLPIISWKKIISKLVTVLCTTIIGIGLGVCAVIAFVLMSSNFDKSIVDLLLNFFKSIFQSPTQFILGALYILFCFSSIYLIMFFCIAFSKSLTSKNKIAVPMGIATFVMLVAAISSLGTLLENVPLAQITILGETDSLSSLILSFIIFIAALFGTSWLMEKKIES